MRFKKYLPELRTFAKQVSGQDDVEEILTFALADEPETKADCLAAIRRYASPFKRRNYETHAIIEAMKSTGNGVKAELKDLPELAKFLEGYERDIASGLEECYHPVLRHVDLDVVDWLDVAAEVIEFREAV